MSTRTRCWRISSRTPRQCSPCASSAVRTLSTHLCPSCAQPQTQCWALGAGKLVTGSADMTIKLWDLETRKRPSGPLPHLIFSLHISWRGLGAVLGTFGGPMPNSGINYTVTGLAQIDDTSFASCADLVKIWTLAAA